MLLEEYIEFLFSSYEWQFVKEKYRRAIENIYWAPRNKRDKHDEKWVRDIGRAILAKMESDHSGLFIDPAKEKYSKRETRRERLRRIREYAELKKSLEDEFPDWFRPWDSVGSRDWADLVEDGDAGLYTNDRWP